MRKRTVLPLIVIRAFGNPFEISFNLVPLPPIEVTAVISINYIDAE
jgi:hypothetical protein